MAKKLKDNSSEGYIRAIGDAAYLRVVTKLHMTTGLSHTHLQEILGQFALELADELAMTDIVSFPRVGNFRVIRPDGENAKIKFYPAKTLINIHRNGGTNANKSLRELGFSPTGITNKSKGNSGEN